MAAALIRNPLPNLYFVVLTLPSLPYTESVKKLKRFKFKKLSYLLFYVFLVSGLGIVLNQSLKQLPGILSSTSNDLSGNSEERIILSEVIDGDTIRVIIGNTRQNIRLIGLNAPETKDCMGNWSRIELEKLLEGQTILLENDSTQGDVDKYGRFLRYVRTAGGININEKLIRIGAAKEYTYDKDYKYKELFVDAQNTAKKDKLGVWGAPCNR